MTEQDVAIRRHLDPVEKRLAELEDRVAKMVVFSPPLPYPPDLERPPRREEAQVGGTVIVAASAVGEEYYGGD